MDIEAIQKQHDEQVIAHRRTRRANALHKKKEYLKTLPMQKGADKYKKSASKKGQGRAKKQKGYTCPKGIPMDSCGKGWAQIHWQFTDKSMREGFTFSWLWIRT